MDFLAITFLTKLLLLKYFSYKSMTENKSFCENDLFREVRVDTRLKLMFFLSTPKALRKLFEREMRLNTHF